MKRNGILATIAGLALATAGCERDSATNPVGGTADTYSRSDRTATNLTERSGTGAATEASNPSRDADNTGRNVRDRSDASVTPGDQGQSGPDLELTQKIRRAVVNQDQLSANAKNVKIITANGKVTLRGPVASEQERQLIAQLAQAAAGTNAVDNQIEVEHQTQSNTQTDTE